VYVDDADSAYGRELAAGAAVLEEPLDTPYGDRRAMVRDPFGNVFQIASRSGANPPSAPWLRARGAKRDTGVGEGLHGLG
jgi:hypothetical protein